MTRVIVSVIWFFVILLTTRIKRSAPRRLIEGRQFKSSCNTSRCFASSRGGSRRGHECINVALHLCVTACGFLHRPVFLVPVVSIPAEMFTRLDKLCDIYFPWLHSAIKRACNSIPHRWRGKIACLQKCLVLHTLGTTYLFVQPL